MSVSSVNNRARGLTCIYRALLQLGTNVLGVSVQQWRVVGFSGPDLIVDDSAWRGFWKDAGRVGRQIAVYFILHVCHTQSDPVEGRRPAGLRTYRRTRRLEAVDATTMSLPPFLASYTYFSHLYDASSSGVPRLAHYRSARPSPRIRTLLAGMLPASRTWRL